MNKSAVFFWIGLFSAIAAGYWHGWGAGCLTLWVLLVGFNWGAADVRERMGAEMFKQVQQQMQKISQQNDDTAQRVADALKRGARFTQHVH